MVRLTRFYTHRHERGISLMFVVVAIFALLGVTALAIDLVTLYVSKSEGQRIADAAALAGAKALVDSGVTADPTNSANVWDTACDLATVQAQGVANKGLIGGAAPSLVSVCFKSGASTCSSSCPSSGIPGSGFGVNPQVGVTVNSATLPLFFGKIWGQKTATVSATSLAEGFNPSGTNFPVAAKCVMPWLLPNLDPAHTATGQGRIVGLGSGRIRNAGPAPAGTAGETVNLLFGCQSGDCTLGVVNPAVNPPPPPSPPPYKLTYYPLDLPNPAASGPSCSVGGAYQQNIVACNPTPIACGDQVTLNATLTPASVPNTQSAVQCLIGATGAAPGVGQDTLNTAAFPYTIQAGANNPLVANASVAAGDVISSSRSVVTIPIYDAGGTGVKAAPVTPVTVVGFVQAFVSGSKNGDPTIQILNVSGCGTTARGSSVPPVGTNEASSVPVRLIRP
jgi:Flp pilus assembly protein TadG